MLSRRIDRHGAEPAPNFVDLSAAKPTNLTLTGTEGPDTLTGGNGDDQLFGLGGSDSLDGGAGNDWLDGGPGHDLLIGGDGYDTASYADVQGSLDVTLVAGADATVLIDGRATDTLREVEAVIGGDFADRLFIAGSAFGGDGDDLMFAFFADGGDGYDTLDFSKRPVENAYVAYSINMYYGEWKGYGDSFSISSSGRFQNIEHVIGSRGSDSITGSAGDDVIEGGAGDDVISTGYGAGQDVVDGGDGYDRIYLSGGSVTAWGGADGDLFTFYSLGPKDGSSIVAIDGGEGVDSLMFKTSGLKGGVTADLAKGTLRAGVLSASIASIEIVTATSGADHLSGDDRANTFRGGNAADVLSGGDGDDLLYGDTGNDVLSGQKGNDRLYDISVTGGSAGTLTGGAGADIFSFVRSSTDIADSSHQVITDFSHSQGDRIDLSYVDAEIATRRYDALRFIGKGAFSGARELRYEIVDGDTHLLANVDGDAEPEYVLILSGEHKIRLEDLIGVLDGLERDDAIVGTRGNDTLVGMPSDDVIRGGDGNDALSGGDGADRLKGQGGDDILAGGLGRDVLSGGDGRDTADYSAETRNVTVVLDEQGDGSASSNGVTEDKLSSIEALIGGSGDDRLFGGWILSGGDGDDYLGTTSRYSLSSPIDGGAGVDTFSAENYYGRIYIDVARGVYTTDHNYNYAVLNIENIVGTQNDDEIRGNGDANTLIGGGGNDYLLGAGGADYFTYRLTSESSLAPDKIGDFSQADGDKIDLSAIDAITSTPVNDAFHFIGATAFSGTAGELRYRFSGGDTLVSGDTDGDSAADLTIRLTGNIVLTAADFIGANAALPFAAEHAAPFQGHPVLDHSAMICLA